MTLMDAWGDGWDQGTYAFAGRAGGLAVAASGTLVDGATGVERVCLADGCYDLVVSGSAYPSEISFAFDALSGGGLAVVPFSLVLGALGDACDAEDDDGCLEISLEDSAGDGWDGTSFVVSSADDGVLATGTLDEGFSTRVCLRNLALRRRSDSIRRRATRP